LRDNLASAKVGNPVDETAGLRLSSDSDIAKKGLEREQKSTGPDENQ
jgi:hypothetical protein